MSTPTPAVVKRARQQIVLDAIIELTDEFGFSPSEREIALRVGRPLVSTHEVVVELLEGGYIAKPDRVTARSIRVLKERIE